jgi:REase_DpnII-MboI
MVSVKGSTEVLLSEVERSLAARLRERPLPDLHRLFSTWLSGGAADPGVLAIMAAAAERSGAQQDYQSVATLAFGLASGFLDDASIESLKSGFERLVGRSPFVDGVPMAFCSDAVAVLSFALAVCKLNNAVLTTKLCEWLKSFVPAIVALEGTDDWQRCVFAAADLSLGGGMGLSRSCADECSDIIAALKNKGLSMLPNGTDEALYLNVIRTALADSTADLPLDRAIFRSAALTYVRRSAPIAIPGRMTTASLIKMLERFPAGLRNWTWELKPRTTTSQARRWSIDHEYHVQNMLWFLLSPIFPDLDDEQYLAKIGQKNPRADLYIPSMKVMIEAKFIRKGKSFQSIIDEIASDASLYSAMGNDFAGLIAFVWDDSGRSQEHDYLKQGLGKLQGVLETVVVSRPSDWQEVVTTPPSTEA